MRFFYVLSLKNKYWFRTNEKGLSESGFSEAELLCAILRTIVRNVVNERTECCAQSYTIFRTNKRKGKNRN